MKKLQDIEEVFNAAVELVLVEGNEKKAIEVSFESLKERESFRIKLYKQKQLLNAKFPDVARKLSIRSLNEGGVFKVRLSKISPLNVALIDF